MSLCDLASCAVKHIMADMGIGSSLPCRADSRTVVRSIEGNWHHVSHQIENVSPAVLCTVDLLDSIVGD